PLFSGGEKHRSHRRGLSDADRLNVRLDVLHRVVDRQARGDRAAGRVDVKRDVFLGILGFEEQKLGNDQIRNGIVNGLAEEDDVVFEESGVDVVGALAATGLLHDHGNEDHQFAPTRSLESYSAV